MSRYLAVFALLLAPACGKKKSHGTPESIIVAVDARVELLSILCHLAGNPEYNRAYASPYLTAIDTYLAPFRDHPAVLATRELRVRDTISFNAPMHLAAYLSPELWPTRSLRPAPPFFDARWATVDINAYLAKVRDFAEDTNFPDFFDHQRPYFDAVEARFRELVASHPIIPWFDATFGVRRARYHLAPGLLTGGMNYSALALNQDGSEDIVQVMFLEQPDPGGLPHPTAKTLEYLAHELAHSYVNPVIDAEMASFEPIATPLFQRVQPAMAELHYNDYRIMVNESVVRAVTVLYLRDKSTSDHAAESEGAQVLRGFLWTPALVTALDGVRKKNGGRIPPAELVAVTRATLASLTPK